MPFGGTSWGWLPASVVYTSYDYGAAISEARQLTPKIPAMKEMGYFLQSVTDIANAAKHELLDAIDILTPNVISVQPQNGPSQRPAYDEWLKRPGKEIWWYQSCNSHESCDYGKPGPLTATTSR